MNKLQQKVNDLINESQYNKACDLVMSELDFTIETLSTELKEKFDDVRLVSQVEIKRGARSFIIDFGSSINDSKSFLFPKGYIKDEWSINQTIKIMKAEFRSGVNDIKKYKVKSYDLLYCLQKHEVGSFDDFCSEFGYDNDSIKAQTLYNNVLEELNNMKMLFTDKELEILQEIQ